MTGRNRQTVCRALEPATRSRLQFLAEDAVGVGATVATDLTNYAMMRAILSVRRRAVPWLRLFRVRIAHGDGPFIPVAPPRRSHLRSRRRNANLTFNSLQGHDLGQASQRPASDPVKPVEVPDSDKADPKRAALWREIAAALNAAPDSSESESSSCDSTQERLARRFRFRHRAHPLQADINIGHSTVRLNIPTPDVGAYAREYIKHPRNSYRPWRGDPPPYSRLPRDAAPSDAVNDRDEAYNGTDLEQQYSPSRHRHNVRRPGRKFVRGSSVSGSDTGGASAAEPQQSGQPNPRIYRRKSFKHDIDRDKNMERQAKSIKYQTLKRVPSEVADLLVADRDRSRAAAEQQPLPLQDQTANRRGSSPTLRSDSCHSSVSGKQTGQAAKGVPHSVSPVKLARQLT